MGLDMYLEGHEANTTPAELGYWRKHPNLHGFIVQEFADGVDECQKIPLTAENLESILEATQNDALPHTTGFFFGQSMPEDKEQTLEIVEGALKWLKEGKPGRQVIYQASW
jgi:hypothetical protein